MGVIRDSSERFGQIRWKDSMRARQLVNRGLELMNGYPSTEALLPIAHDLINLMPEGTGPTIGVK